MIFSWLRETGNWYCCWGERGIALAPISSFLSLVSENLTGLMKRRTFHGTDTAVIILTNADIRKKNLYVVALDIVHTCRKQQSLKTINMLQ